MLFDKDESDALYFNSIIMRLLTENLGEYTTFSGWSADYIEAYTSDFWL